MKKIVLLVLALAVSAGACLAAELEYFQVYKPKSGMSADEIMQIKYFVKYTKFARDAEFAGKAYYIDKSGSIRERGTLRRRINLGRESDGIAYKDLILFTSPVQVKGLGILTWTYLDPRRDTEQWMWLPSLKKVRKISQAEGDDAFMGADFTVEEITTRKFEDETYKLAGEENFKGYTSVYTKKTYYDGTPVFVIEARPKRANWYYSKRICHIDKATGGDILDEIYDANGKLFRTLFRAYEIYKVDGKDYPAQTLVEGRDLRTGHSTAITNDKIAFDQGFSENMFTERSLAQSRW
jgi:hypothetical protein